jgi:hypothetical protein
MANYNAKPYGQFPLVEKTSPLSTIDCVPLDNPLGIQGCRICSLIRSISCKYGINRTLEMDTNVLLNH